MRNLITLRKASRKEAYLLVKRLREGALLAPREQDELLNFFAPALPKIAKTAFNWVAAACGVRDIRSYLNVVHVKDGEMIASDGHRMHWAATTLDDGQYDPKTGLKLEESQGPAPNFDRVKEVSNRHDAPFDLSNGEIIPREKFPPAFKIFKDVQVNSAYLLTALNTKEPQGVCYVRRDRVFGSNAFGGYVVMRLRE